MVPWAVRGSPDTSPRDGPVTARAPSTASLPVCPAGLESALWPSLPAPGAQGSSSGQQGAQRGSGPQEGWPPPGAGSHPGEQRPAVGHPQPRLSGSSVDRGPSQRLSCAPCAIPGGQWCSASAHRPVLPSLRPCASCSWGPPTAPWRCPHAKKMSSRWGPSAAPSAAQVGATLQGPCGGHGRVGDPPAPSMAWSPSVHSTHLHGRRGASRHRVGEALHPRAAPAQGKGCGASGLRWALKQSQDSGAGGMA